MLSNSSYSWGLCCGATWGPSVGLTSKDSLYLGAHFLGFYQALFTWPGLLEAQFVSVVEDTQFGRFNNREDVQWMEHCAPWKDQKKPKNWKDRTYAVLDCFQQLRVLMNRRLKIYNYSATVEWAPIRNHKFTAHHGADPSLYVKVYPLENVTHGSREPQDTVLNCCPL